MLPIGSIFGSISGGVLSHFLGRRTSLIFDNAIFMVSAVTMIMAWDATLLILGRFLSGWAVGSACVVVPVYIGEICQPKARAYAASLHSNGFLFGSAFMSLIGAVFHWRWAISISGFIPLAAFIGLIFCPETPIWLLKHKQNERLYKALKCLIGDDEMMQLELERLSKFHQLNNNDNDETWCNRAKNLFQRKSFLKSFLICCFLYVGGFDFAGFCALNFYMVQIIEVTKYTYNQKSYIPFEPTHA